jgi:NAD(P)-dependent dehydrogenase (short-subunit alcohol dehydrogenase family)
MGTKWAVEALCQTLRLECKLTRKRIDVSMLNPGFVTTPTLLHPRSVHLGLFLFFCLGLFFIHVSFS